VKCDLCEERAQRYLRGVPVYPGKILVLFENERIIKKKRESTRGRGTWGYLCHGHPGVYGKYLYPAELRKLCDEEKIECDRNCSICDR
jgi:hypothetical protein